LKLFLIDLVFLEMLPIYLIKILLKIAAIQLAAEILNWV
jgi:hypothetical protein